MTPRILIADDHEDTREALEWFLRKEGFRVTGVGNGLEALREMQAAAAPEILLLDLEMPWVSGWDVLTRMSQDPALRGIPTIVVSGHIANRRTPRDLIALAKPVDPDRLLAAVHALVGESSVLRPSGVRPSPGDADRDPDR